MAAVTEKQVLSAAMLSVFQEKRLTVYFMCLEESELSFNKYIYLFATSENLIKHFKQKHLINYKEED